MAWDEEQQKNAAIIVQVGRELGASDRDIQISLMTALQESGLRNVNYGDRDSIGLFQQRRPWGSDEQRMDPRESARMFFQGGHTGQPGLFSKKNRDTMSLTQAAQAVQVSAFPDAYAKHEKSALDLMGGASGVSATPQPGSPASVAASPLSGGINQVGTGMGANTAGINQVGVQDFADGGMDFLPKLSLEQFMEQTGGTQLPGPFGRPVAPVAATGMRKRVIDYAMGLVGTPYRWGGSDSSGVDCSGLAFAAYNSVGVSIPRVSYAQATYGRTISMDQAQPGDIVGWDNSARNNGADHVAMYLGNGQIIESPRTGLNVRIRRLDPDEQVWFSDMSGVTGA